MKILIVGSGGREHALAWKIAKSPRVEKIYCAPGNGGTRLVAENVPLADTDIAGLADFAEREKIGLTVVGPEVPLTMGIVDEFERRGLRVFGPSKKAAEIEGSKVFAKEFMSRHRIPTGRFKVADSFDAGPQGPGLGRVRLPRRRQGRRPRRGQGRRRLRHARRRPRKTAGEMLVQKKFGAAGRRIVIEEFLRGREVSFIVISDGLRVQPLVTAMDHKAAYDGDKGPNTGGMGAISPSPLMTEKLFDEIMATVITPTVTRLLEEGRKFKGVLYAGLMITEAGPAGPRVQRPLRRPRDPAPDGPPRERPRRPPERGRRRGRPADRGPLVAQAVGLRRRGLGRLSRPLREGQDHLRPGRGGGGPRSDRLPRRDEVRERHST